MLNKGFTYYKLNARGNIIISDLKLNIRFLYICNCNYNYNNAYNKVTKCKVMSRGSAGLMWSVGLSDNIYKKEWFYSTW
jgi:hypothetical protein